jgi:hypothetical protein
MTGNGFGFEALQTITSRGSSALQAARWASQPLEMNRRDLPEPAMT